MNQNPETPSAVPDVKEEEWNIAGCCVDISDKQSVNVFYEDSAATLVEAHNASIRRVLEKKEAVAESVDAPEKALGEKEPQDQSTSSTQKPLSVLLDEIEERAKGKVRNLGHGVTQNIPGDASDVSALVKALRRAVELLAWGTGKATLLTGTREAEIAALLNQGRTSE